ncbi:MAG: WD40 repeat domain-containing protein [Flavobacteriales bacterium]|nr:WD40 repeat domain-containing protein [Flavobacteriales bacterium]
MNRSFFILLLCFSFSGFGQNLKLEHIRTFSGHSHGVRKVVFSPDGSHFASGGTRGELFIWNIDGEQGVKKLEGHYGSISDVRYSLDGKYLVSAGEDGQVKVWDAESGYCLQQIISPTASNSPVNKINFAIYSEKSGKVYFGGTNRNLCTLAFRSKENPEVIYSDDKEAIQCGIVSPDGSEIIFAAGAYLMAMNLKSGEIVREYNTGSCQVNALEFSEDGKRLLTWCNNSRVDVRDPSTFYLITSFRSGTGGRKFSNLAFTEDQKYVVTGDHASRFNVWDLDNKQRVLDQGAEQGTILAFDVESGPNYLLSGSLDKSIKLWQIVPEVEDETKKKKSAKKQPENEQVVEPEVEIVQYVEPIEDVPQVKVEHRNSIEVEVQLKEPEKVETYQPTPKAPYRSIVSEVPERKENRRVKPIRHEHKLELTGNKLTFEIWDAQVIDGDIVSIYVGDECIVKEYSITDVKKTVTFDASAYKRVYVYLHAHNLGTLPPNTVTMTVSDGEQTHQIELRSDLSGSAALELTFVDPED